jgi:hypothetical protein
MATPGFDLTGLTGYVDENSFDLIASAVLGTELANNVSVRAGLKGNSVDIPVMSDDFTVGDGNSCGWSAPSSASIEQVNMCMYHAKIQHEFCVQSLRDTFMAQALAAGQFGGSENLPYEATYVDYFVKRLKNWNEKFLIDGKGTCTGFRQAISGSGVSAAGYNTDWTTSNAVAGAQALYEALPNDVALADDLILVLGPHDYKALSLNATQLNYFHIEPGVPGRTDLYVPGTGVKAVACAGIKNQTDGKNTRILTRASNLIMGTDLTGDFETFKMWYSEDNDQVRATMKWAIGAAAAEPDMAVIANPTVANFTL